MSAFRASAFFTGSALFLAAVGCGNLIGLGGYSKGQAAATGGNGGEGGTITPSTGGGAPVDCAKNADCDDDVPCTVDTCNDGACSNEPDDSECPDTVCGAGVCDAKTGCVEIKVTKVDLLENGGFETSPDDVWGESSTQFSGLISDATALAVNDYAPNHGEYAAWLGGTNDETSILDQAVTPIRGTCKLTYSYYVDSGAADAFDADDTGWVFLWDNEAATSVESFWSFTGEDENRQWDTKSHEFDCTKYIGKDVAVNFMATTDDDTDYTHFIVDDVSLTVETFECPN